MSESRRLSEKEPRPVLFLVSFDERVARVWQRVLAERAIVRVFLSVELAALQFDAGAGAAWRATVVDVSAAATRLGLLGANRPAGPLCAVHARPSAQLVLDLGERSIVVLQRPRRKAELVRLVEALVATRNHGAATDQFARTFRLSAQEHKLLRVAVAGATNKEAAEVLGCAYSTIRTYWSRMYQKTQTACTRELFALLFRSSVAVVEQRS